MTAAFATGADAPYGYHLLNLLGSLRVNSDVFDRVAAYDLGLDTRQRRLLAAVPGVEVATVPPFVPHWAQGFTWKTWVWTHLDSDTVFWLDAGATLLRSLAPALDQIRERGYFVVSQGNRLRDIVPEDYAELYELPAGAAERPYVAAGIIGFSRESDFYRRVIVPTYEDCVRGRNLGFSPAEETGRNRGLMATPDPPLRDCLHFRWDQTLLNIHLARELPDAFVNDLDEYAGWRSRHDHPRQVIWSHRRHGDLAYLKRIRYVGRGAWRARAFGAWFQLRWWFKLHKHLFRRSTYTMKASAVLRTLRLR